MSESLSIKSHVGPYHVAFADDAVTLAAAVQDVHVIVDRRVAELHKGELAPLLSGNSVLQLEATEKNKALERMPEFVAELLKRGIRKDHHLLAIGGGIIQDITCFLSATLMRGIDWMFLPTTLLAQCDSCIGSKSSINSGDTKNIVGTFTPPSQVWISGRFLPSLDERDLRSGVGEMLKVHAIDGPASFDRLARDYDSLFSNPNKMLEYIHRALVIKKPFIEADEFDLGVRNVLNFGHSFGHAIEAATDFGVPHGIAVTIGMDVALEVARGIGMTGEDTVTRMRSTLRRNARGFLNVPVPMDRFLTALSKDKKNRGSGTATVVLPHSDGKIARSIQPVDERFRHLCARYFESASREHAA